MKHVILLVLCYLALGVMPCQADVTQTAATYSFPFQPDDETWKTYQSADDLKEALQIPSDVIKSIATDNLLDLCISYPYNIDMLSRDNAEDGFNLLRSEFNGYAELLIRNDLGSMLISKFEAIPSEIDLIPAMNEEEVDDLSLKYYVVYYILGLDDVISEFDEVQMELYYNAINENLSKMAQYPDVFGLSYQQCLKLLPYSTLSDFEYTYLPITTPNGYKVDAFKLIESTELSSSNKRKLKNSVETLYPGVIVIGEATGKYNCHAYAWHHKKVPNSDAVWIDEPNPYWETGCYYEVPISEAEIVTYELNGNLTHSAIRISDDEYESKWGPWPLVRHSPTNVPCNLLDPDNNYGKVSKGYKRLNATMIGNGFIKTSSTFSVEKLLSSYFVEWTISDDYYSKNCLVANRDGTCTITRNDNKDIFGATLTATVKYYNKTDLVTYTSLILTRPVYAYKNFWGTYDCIGYSNASLTYPYIINTTLGDNILIKSPSLKGASVTYEGDITPRYFSFDNNVSSLDLVDYGQISTGLSSTGSALVIHVVTADGERYDLIILAQSRSGALSSSFKDQILTIRYDQETEPNAVYSGYLPNESTDSVRISVEICELLTNTKIYEAQSDDNEIHAYTGDWKPGMYTVTAKANNEIITKKILVK